MIVRINQIELSRVESDARWPAGPHTGPLRANWPDDARAFELLILSEDEQRQPITADFRQQQLRQMIVQVAIALATPPESGNDAEPLQPAVPLVLRLDGKVAAEELLPAWQHLTAPGGKGRYAFAASVKLDEEPTDVSGSVQIVPSWRLLADVCSDLQLGFERSVRLRLLAMPQPFLPVMLDAAEADDPRWAHLLGECPLYIGSTTELRSLHIVIRQADAAQVKSRVMKRLMAVAGGAPAVPE